MVPCNRLSWPLPALERRSISVMLVNRDTHSRTTAPLLQCLGPLCIPPYFRCYNDYQPMIGATWRIQLNVHLWRAQSDST